MRGFDEAHSNPWVGSQNRCSVQEGSFQPLVVDWSAAERGALERRLRRGLVVVRSRGCTVEILRQCEVPEATYSFEPVTPKSETVRIDTIDELYANLPLSAARLEARVSRESSIEVDVHLVGMFESSRVRVERNELAGSCADATHVVSAASVGSYALSAKLDASGAVHAATTLTGVPLGAGYEARRGRVVLHRDGDPRRCEPVSDAARQPPTGCAAVLRIELTPLGASPTTDPVCPGALRWDSRQCVAPAKDRVEAACAAGRDFVPGGWNGGTYVEGFCLDRTEVTVRRYRTCVVDQGCPTSQPVADWPGIAAAEREEGSRLCNAGAHDRATHPMNCVTWTKARAYCQQQGADLPTELQWWWAASGGQERRIYPWGSSDPDAVRVNACGSECAAWFSARGQRRRTAYADSDGWPGTAPAASFAPGKARWGSLNLAGNVAEWTLDAVRQRREHRRIRGGSFWVSHPRWLSNDDRASAIVDRKDPVIGFRCAQPLRHREQVDVSSFDADVGRARPKPAVSGPRQDD